jgi:hypothetical protein
MFNQDIIDLYSRVPLDTNVVVLDANDNVEPPAPPMVADRRVRYD